MWFGVLYPLIVLFQPIFLFFLCYKENPSAFMDVLRIFTPM